MSDYETWLNKVEQVLGHKRFRESEQLYKWFKAGYTPLQAANQWLHECF